MFGADTSRPVTVAAGNAFASRNTSDPVPQPTSSSWIARFPGTCCTTISHMRADRSAGAEHVLSANSVGTFIHHVSRLHERKSLALLADVLEKAAIRGEHPLVAAETALAVREQHNHATGSRDQIRALDPQVRDLVRRVSEKPQAAITRHRQRQLANAFDRKRTRRCAAVVGYGKKAARCRNAAVVVIAAREIAQQRPRAQQRWRAIADAAVPFG